MMSRPLNEALIMLYYTTNYQFKLMLIYKINNIEMYVSSSSVFDLEHL